jgi:hypothetical protein
MNHGMLLVSFFSLLVLTRVVSADAYQDYRNKPTSETAFAYLHQVTTHQRCVNCHGAVEENSQRPLVGEDSHVHPMNISNANNLMLKVVGTTFVEAPNSTQPVNCRSCHRDANGTLIGTPPGAANDLMPGFVWHMPPPTMILTRDLTQKQLCDNWLNPAKNSFLVMRGGRDDLVTFEKEFVHHVRDDPLVRWAWAPGPGRAPAPGAHEDFVKAMQLWINGGAKCPAKNDA